VKKRFLEHASDLLAPAIPSGPAGSAFLDERHLFLRNAGCVKPLTRGGPGWVRPVTSCGRERYIDGYETS